MQTKVDNQPAVTIHVLSRAAIGNPNPGLSNSSRTRSTTAHRSAIWRRFRRPMLRATGRRSSPASTRHSAGCWWRKSGARSPAPCNSRWRRGNGNHRAEGGEAARSTRISPPQGCHGAHGRAGTGRAQPAARCSCSTLEWRTRRDALFALGYVLTGSVPGYAAQP